jgi:hypothetical protein
MKFGGADDCVDRTSIDSAEAEIKSSAEADPRVLDTDASTLS